MLSKRKYRPRCSSPGMGKLLKSLILNPSRFKDLLLLLSLFLSVFLIFHQPHAPLPLVPSPPSSSATRRHHLLFSIASSSASFANRRPYIRLWYNPHNTRAIAFLDAPAASSDPTLPPTVVSADTSRFPYTLKGGLRSAVRVARVVKEAVDRNETGIRWFVFGDDDTIFVVDNLVKVLSKYDHEKWFYVGSNSESYGQNAMYSFDMAFGGGGFALSTSLAKALAKVLDSCLMRYGHLYGSDSRIWSCLVELGVGLTHEPGFHQLDMRGNILGMLTSHPMSPLLSLHHLDAIHPIFPDMNKTQALERFFEAVSVDSARMLQHTVCYDHLNSFTVSVAWGYAVQVYEGNQLLPDLISLQKTFSSWRRGFNAETRFMFNTRDHPRDPCKRPLIFFLESVLSGENGVWSNYTRHNDGNCHRTDAVKNLKMIRIFSRKLELEIDQMNAPRRGCCEVSPLDNQSFVINMRQCGSDELTAMHI